MDENIEEQIKDMDCAPLHEAIVAQNHIVSIWVYSDCITGRVIFLCEVFQLKTETSERDYAWLEDGTARCGNRIKHELLDDFEQALEWVHATSKEILVQERGALNNPINFAV